jgi:hypothetical protein
MKTGKEGKRERRERVGPIWISAWLWMNNTDGYMDMGMKEKGKPARPCSAQIQPWHGLCNVFLFLGR